MTQYISKSAVVAEIERRLKGLENCHADRIAGYAGEISGLKRLLSFLDTLEVKEVDLEKETDKYISENFYGSETLGFFANRTKEEPNWKDIALCAKHFFELGLKTRKGE